MARRPADGSVPPDPRERSGQGRSTDLSTAPTTAPRSEPALRRPPALPPSRLARRTDPRELRFRTTADLPSSDAIVGQERAVEAIELAVGMTAPGYNIFAMGPPGIGKMTALRQALQRVAAGRPAPDDWCYVHDFHDPQRPRALRLPAGRSVGLRAAMTQFCLDLRVAIVAVFEGEAYRGRRERLEGSLEKRRDEALRELGDRAAAAHIAIVRTPIGVAVGPMRDGRTLEPEEFQALPAEERERFRRDLEHFGEELQELLREVPHWQRDLRRRIDDLDREVTRATAHRLVDEVRSRFRDLPQVLRYLDDVEDDVALRASELRAAAALLGDPRAESSPATSRGAPFLAAAGIEVAQGEVSSEAGPDALGSRDADEAAGVVTLGGSSDPFRRYCVNVLVDSSAAGGAPLVVEDHPTQPNLVGRIEHRALMGSLVTDFTLIRPGALHRANGGYLVVEAEKVLAQPYAWEQLKRSLKSGQVRVESPAQSLGLLTTVALEPEPIPLEVKVALTGDRRLYYLACEADPEFLELFKVQADFEEAVDRTPDSVASYARLVATLVDREGLAPFDAGAVARALDALARAAEDGCKLSTQVGSLTDLLREADHVARNAGRPIVAAADVEAAAATRRRRAGRIYERLQEAVRRGTLAVPTAGWEVGQVNALSVITLGDVAFGHPSRVTAAVRLGRGEVVDIEREVAMGGPIHSKGVLILAGFLGDRFGGPGRPGAPLAVNASLVFEQSYAGVEGDSASLAELCALLSAIGEVPLRQDVAVTGSVDQKGRVQAVGGVNEKVEGFFDACRARGASGSEGVIVPSVNVDHLMLADRVVEAARGGRFRVWPVTRVDEALALLTRQRVGRRDREGRFPAGTVNARIEARLASMVKAAREHGDGQRRSDRDLD